MIRKRLGQGTAEFLLIMALLLGVGVYLASKMLGHQGAISMVQDGVNDKIANDAVTN